MNDHRHNWSYPVAELGGKRACRQCGKIATREEMRAIFFAERNALRAEIQRARKIA
jgi:hypothetical protein